MATKQEIRMAAQELGRTFASTDDLIDFYDVVSYFIDGYAEGSTEDKSANAFRSRLVAAESLRTAAGTVTAWIVDDAREAGASWSEVAYPLDISKQAAQQRFGS